MFTVNKACTNSTPHTSSIHKKKRNCIKKIPDEVINHIFSYLNYSDIYNASFTCKNWNRIESKYDSLKKMIYEFNAFGKDKWVKVFDNNIFKNGKEDYKALSNDIVKQFLRNYHSDKRILDTHDLIWIPEEIYEKKLTLNSFGELIKSKFFPKTKDGYSCFNGIVKDTHGDTPLDYHGWVLISKTSLEECSTKRIKDQKKLVQEFAKKIRINYQIPKTLEAAVYFFTVLFQTDYKKLSFKKQISIRCEDTIDIEGRDYQVCLKSFEPRSAAIFFDYQGKTIHNVMGLVRYKA